MCVFIHTLEKAAASVNSPGGFSTETGVSLHKNRCLLWLQRAKWPLMVATKKGGHSQGQIIYCLVSFAIIRKEKIMNL